MTSDRKVARVSRQFRDRITARLSDIPATRHFYATVTTVVTGGGPGGNALVKVTWRGVELTAKSYNGTYTPVVGHRVKCSIDDSQLVVDGGPYIN